MAGNDLGYSIRHCSSPADLGALGPLWSALQSHHAELTPSLAGDARSRDLPEAWRVRQGKYRRWLEEPETFFLIAEDAKGPLGYAFVTVGPGLASWKTGDRVAELQTLSVLPEHRNVGVGGALLATVQERLADLDVDELLVTTAIANIDSQRFYERHGLRKSFLVYYGKAQPEP